MNVLLFGPPGAGKGTQAGVVSGLLGVPHVATGDIFRRHLREGTALGELARSYMSQGKLVPDEVVVDIVTSRLSDPDAVSGVLFDGFPRTVNQAQLLADWLAKNGRGIDLVLNLVVPDEVIVRRLSGRRSCLNCGATYHVDANPPASDGSCTQCGTAVVQREDDQEATVAARLNTYHSETAPVLGWARGFLRVVDVDANQSIAAVQSDLESALRG